MAKLSNTNPNTKHYSLLIILYVSLAGFVSAKSPNSLPSHFSKFTRPSNKPHGSETLTNKKFDTSVQLSLDQAKSARAMALNLTTFYRKAQTETIESVVDCLELLDDTLDLLEKITTNSVTQIHDVHTWLSAALTNQQTCLESLREANKIGHRLDSVSRNLKKSITNSLAIYVTMPAKNKKSAGDLVGEEFPTWVSASEKNILESSVEELVVHGVVARDGSGTHKSIKEALGFVTSLAGNGRTVIYVKAGTYHENIDIPTKQKNVMLVGDGKGKTVIIGNRNAKDGWTTFKSATVAAMGDGFMARDITFVNEAGPSKEQAVALRVGSDKSVIYRCSIMGYQDSLYTHSKRQFYRDTDISGTVDFIFGDSAVVFQNCNIFARKPMSGQNNYITAQGRSDPNQNTGISIHKCKITAASDLVKSKTPTYLGRPWREYSRTVIMQSSIDDVIQQAGWSPWSGGFALKTLYYGEYGNSGPGSSVSGRVKWNGYHPSLSLEEAKGFTVAGFIDGNLWLPSTGVLFESGLT